MMRFNDTPLPGAFIIDHDFRRDERGFFVRMFCEREFTSQGLDGQFVQMNCSRSDHCGTLRGMHYQLPPHEETKVLCCTRGDIYDVVVDLRIDSPTFGQHFGVHLRSSERRMVYVPKGCAHGFLTLTSDAEVIYIVSEFYSAEFERGVRWNDPQLNIQWPMQPRLVSERDQQHPDLELASLYSG